MSRFEFREPDRSDKEILRYAVSQVTMNPMNEQALAFAEFHIDRTQNIRDRTLAPEEWTVSRDVINAAKTLALAANAWWEQTNT